MTFAGREEQVAAIDAFLGELGGGAGTILFQGDVGTGKSALLHEGTRRARSRGVRVIRADRQSRNTALGQVITSLADDVDALAPAHRDVLRSIAGGGAEDFTAGSALTTLLRHAADAQPLLVVLDDLHELDEPSVRAMSFAARRKHGRRLGFLAAAIPGHSGAFDDPTVITHDLPPLDDQAVFALLARVAPAAPVAVRQRIAAEAHGNPLALLSFAASLTEEQLLLERPLPPVLAAPADVLERIAPRIASLPHAARLLLLMSALEGTGDARLLARSSANPGADLAEVERAGLCRFDPAQRTWKFTHPLIRSAVVAHAGASDRRVAHWRLARLLQAAPDSTLRHLAAATAGPEATLAARLERAGHQALSRGDNKGAAEFFLMATERSASLGQQRRLVSQARLVSADALRLVSRVELLMATALQTDREPDAALAAALLGGYASMLASADACQARSDLAEALGARGGREDDREQSRFIADQSLWALAHLTHVLGTPGQSTFAEASRRVRSQVTSSTDSLVRLFNDPARASADQIRLLDGRIADLPSADPSDVIRTGMASMFIDRLECCRDGLNRVIRDERRDTSSFLAAHARCMLAFADFRRGDWDAASGRAEQEVMFGAAGDHPLQPLGAYPIRVLVNGLRGQAAQAQRTLSELAEQAAAGHVGAVERMAWARSLLSLAAGDPEAAYRRLAAHHPPGEFPAGQPYALWSAFDLVEAAVRTRRLAAAGKHAVALRALGCAGWSPRLAFLTAASTALASTGPHAITSYEAALRTAQAGHWPLEEARLRLAFGQVLADQRMTVAARDQIRTARHLLDRLGVPGWRPEVEALASAEDEHVTAPTLTAQERRVVELAAAGLSNREIAARLVMSPRTVGGHLYRVFPKLGISSRASLRSALRRYDASARPQVAA